MDVRTFETCWAVNSEIIKRVTSSWSIFIQQQDVHYISKGAHLYISTVKCQWLIERVLDLSLPFLGSYVNESALSTDCSLCQNCQYNITLQAMYVQRNIDARSCKHCCSGRAINSTIKMMHGPITLRLTEVLLLIQRFRLTVLFPNLQLHIVQ